MAKNAVIAGDYAGCRVSAILGTLQISTSLTQSVFLSNDNVESYEVLDETRRKSAANIATRGLIGGFFLGPAGLAAGALSSKAKGAYTVAIQFKDGKKSLLEVDEKVYKTLIRCLF